MYNYCQPRQELIFHGTRTGPADRSHSSKDTTAQNSYRFSFIMPAEFAPDTLPDPEHPAIRIRQVDAQLVAALSCSGTWSESRYREHENMLMGALENTGLVPAGPTVFARYNAPFVPWFLHRNEVLQPVRETFR